MAKTTKAQIFNAREERISAKIFNILADDQYLDSQLKLFIIDEKTLKDFFPREASLKTIVDITSRASLLNYKLGTITLAQTIPVLMTYTIQGASALKINGINVKTTGDTVPTKLILPNYRFEISVTTATTQGAWSFSATDIKMPYGKSRKMSPAVKQDNGAALSVLIDTI